MYDGKANDNDGSANDNRFTARDLPPGWVTFRRSELP